MSKSKIKYILFDAANTLIHKPNLWVNLMRVLTIHNVGVPEAYIKLHHKLLSETIIFPDKTDKAFYNKFNRELLISMGISPNQILLDDIFAACTYLPWVAFEDTAWLNKCDIPCGILSNFNDKLENHINQLFEKSFNNIFASEILQARKPDLLFFKKAIASIGLPVEQILYIGDSFKLDIMPGKAIGLKSLLIDRDNIYPYIKERITSIDEIINYI